MVMGKFWQMKTLANCSELSFFIDKLHCSASECDLVTTIVYLRHHVRSIILMVLEFAVETICMVRIYHK